MNRTEALLVLEAQLRKYREWSYDRLRLRVGLPKISSEVMGASGIRYYLDVIVHWDGEPDADVRVVACIDDGGWRAFVPLTRCFIKASDGSFVDEEAPLPDAEVQRFVSILLQDTRATVGPVHDSIVTSNAERLRAFFPEPDRFLDELVDQVQQQIHDEFIDTTWPTCPRHPNHPLWFEDGKWMCDRDGMAIAELGGLRTPMWRSPSRSGSARHL